MREKEIYYHERKLQRNLKSNEQDPVIIVVNRCRKDKVVKSTTLESNPQNLFLQHGGEETIDSFRRWTSAALSKCSEVTSQIASKVRRTLDKSKNNRGELENFKYPSSSRNKEQLNIINMRKHKTNNAIVKKNHH